MKLNYFLRPIMFILMLVCKYETSPSQNLINNWSFEDTVECPTTYAQLDKAIGWSAYRESPDYYNSCAPAGGPSVPNNGWGNQFASTGNAYVGFTTYGFVTNFREYLGIQLNQATQIGVKYFISFFVSRAANSIGAKLASNNIGMRFSKIAYSVGFPSKIDNYAHLHDSTIITDTINWVKISGSFVSDSIYNYVMFGNFFEDSLTQWIQIGTNSGYAYYYIDDIRISTDSSFVNSIEETNFKPDLLCIYPNLARDWIEVRGNNISQLQIIDVTGRLVLSVNNIILPKRIDISNFANGIYTIRAISKNKLILNKFIKN